jgi:hypothetical protein
MTRKTCHCLLVPLLVLVALLAAPAAAHAE